MVESERHPTFPPMCSKVMIQYGRGHACHRNASRLLGISVIDQMDGVRPKVLLSRFDFG